MAELEIHHEHEEGHGHDPLGKRVAAMAAGFAVLLAVVTILSHRAHTEAVMTRSALNDDWGFYQAKKLKMHSFEVGKDMLQLVAPHGEAVDKKVEDYSKKIEEYGKESEKLQETAVERGKEVKSIETRAFFFDLGEGLLEIGLVMSSLYFMGKKILFPIVGVIGGVAGLALGIYGLFL